MIQTKDKLRTVAELLSESEARVEECVLGMQGIPCLLTNTGTVGLYELFGVRVQVADGNWDAAQEVLHEHHQDGPPWNCAACGTDVDAGFDTCWQCGAERATVVTSPKSFPAESLTAGAGTLPEESDDSQVAREQLRNAWGAAIAGFLVPFLFMSVYSLWLLFQIDFSKLPAGHGGKLIATFTLALFGIWLSLMVLRVF